ncbi:MAG TPA: hypothetical protein VIM92_14640 [Rhodanobacteraceae bacterium]
MAETVTPGSDGSKEGFQWSFDGRLVVVDNGATFASSDAFRTFMGLGSFAVVAFDPNDRLAEHKGLADIEQFQLIANSTLGNGEPVTFHACLDKTLSGTLEPLPQRLEAQPDDAGLKVDPILAHLPMASVRLDDIEGLSNLDWLILDALNDNAAILENGCKALTDTLLIEIHVPFQPSHAGQAEFAAVNAWMLAHGFRFCRFQNVKLKTRFPAGLHLEKMQANDMQGATVLFIPTDARLKSMPANNLMKLSFLLHTVYRLHDLAYWVLEHADAALARRYLIAEGYLWPVDEDETEFTLTGAYSPDIWAQ